MTIIIVVIFKGILYKILTWTTASLSSGDKSLKSVVFTIDSDSRGYSRSTWRSWRGTGRHRMPVTSRPTIAERSSVMARSVLQTVPAGRDEWVSYGLRPSSFVFRKWVAIVHPTCSLSRPVYHINLPTIAPITQLLERVRPTAWLIMRMKDFHTNSDEIFRSVTEYVFPSIRFWRGWLH